MLISQRFERFKAQQRKRELLSAAGQNDLQNVKSLRISPNSRSYVDQRAKTESHRLYMEASRKAGRTTQDKFAASAFAAIEFLKKHQK